MKSEIYFEVGKSGSLKEKNAFNDLMTQRLMTTPTKPFSIKIVLPQHIKYQTMKNAFKISLLALAVSLSVAGCKGNKSGSNSDSAKMDSSSSIKSSTDTSVKVDSVKATDSTTAKVDTVSKTVNKKTETKKTVVKKEKQ